jgi:hypothetical protein
MAELALYRETLDAFGKEVIKRAQANLRKKRNIRGRSVNRVYKGTLQKELTFGYFKRGANILQWFGVKPSSPVRNYADVIEKGRRPDPNPVTWPPRAPIAAWMEYKKLFDPNKSRHFQVTKMVESIGTRGIVGINYMRDAFQDTLRVSGKEFRVMYQKNIIKQMRLKADKYIK